MPLIIFILVPIAEIAMFMVVGDLIGFWPTLGLVVITAFIGTTLLRQQGLAVLQQAQQSGARGEIPVNSVMDGIFLLLAGAFLLTPGILTDIVGFSFMVPAVRRGLGKYFYKRFAKNISASSFGFESHGHGFPGPDTNRSPRTPPNMPQGAGPIIDGEVIRDDHDNDNSSPDRNSPWHKG